MVSKVFLDINVLLDFFLKRTEFESVEQLLLRAKKREIKVYVSSSILQTTSYYLQKSYDTHTCKLLLLEFLRLAHVIEASQETIHQALKSSIDDIEDAIHYFTALTHEMDYLVSSDKQFQKVAISNLPILSIEDMDKKLSQ
ncbi:MAG: PIN domain-containing protein [Pedobacter sp.]|nr:MAG: PIN domain-containing protein [Pedobacter sp.]